jgi:hypothetical protein
MKMVMHSKFVFFLGYSSMGPKLRFIGSIRSSRGGNDFEG